METKLVGKWVRWTELKMNRQAEDEIVERRGEIVGVEYARDEKRFVVLVKVYNGGIPPYPLLQAYADNLTLD